MSKRTIAMIFLDGVGIGPKNSNVNPFFHGNYPTFKELFGGIIPSSRNRISKNSDYAVVPLNATLGIPGLPQSGTGQTALFTGKNAAKIVGKHFGPYPYSSLMPVIKKENIFIKSKEKNKRCSFVNAYPAQFFRYISDGKRKLTVTTLSCLMSDTPLHTADDLRNGCAISADITNERWGELGYPDIPVISAYDAGKRFADISGNHDFTLFEYWLPDHAGHAQEMEFAVNVLERLDQFIRGVTDNMSSLTLLVITSDHGNVEDLRIKTHTRNPVPLWVYGRESSEFIDGLTSITQVCSRIFDWLKTGKTLR